MIRETVTAWPLSWPAGWPRTAPEHRGSHYHFRATTVFHEVQEVLLQLRRLGVHEREIVISTGLRVKPDGIPYSKQPRVEDPGAAVWFMLHGSERVLACDRWPRVEHNLKAIALHISAIRGQERWGVGSADQAFAGFVALPEQAGGMPWWEYFGVGPDATEGELHRAYRESAKVDHPDVGGRREDWDRLEEMKRAALAAIRGRGAR